MPAAHHVTDEEYQRLIDQDLKDDDSDPWRVLRYGFAPQAPSQDPQAPGQTAWGRKYPSYPLPLCKVCQRPREACICDPV